LLRVIPSSQAYVDLDHRICPLAHLSLAPLDLAALLCSRVCHDVISPVGAIVNGLEVLDAEVDPEMRSIAMDLIKKSAEAASARIQFCRLAFGAAGSLNASIDTGDAENVARGLLSNDRTRLQWNTPRRLVPKNIVKLGLNLCLVGATAVPRGGVLSVEMDGDNAVSAIRVTAEGMNARLPHSVAKVLTGESAESIDAYSIQPYYVLLLANQCGMEIKTAVSTENVTLTATLADQCDGRAPFEKTLLQI
jgi:histidine phosphotransferase ChpT